MAKYQLFLTKYALQGGITLVFILILAGAFLSYWSNLELQKRNQFVVDRAAMEDCIDDVSHNVNLLDLGLRGYYMIPEEGLLSPYNTSLKVYKSNLEKLKGYADKYGYPAMDSIDFIIEQIVGYEKLVGSAIEEIRSGNASEAKKIFSKDPGYAVWKSYQPVLYSLGDFFTAKEVETRTSYKQIDGYRFISQILLLGIALPVLIFVIVRMNYNDKKINKLFSDLDESNRKYVYNNGESDDVSNNQENIIKDLIANLKKASHFIQGITQDNLDVKWEGLNESNAKLNENTISGELITMREQIRKVKDEEQKRYWITEGLSKFAEIVRLNQDDIKKLNDTLITQVVNYTKSNQGGLFLLKEEQGESFLEMASCYAYDKKKFVEKRIEIGQGLLGQAFAEGETVFLKEVPDGYTNITSGMGDSQPKNLLIVPLRINEQVKGVLELASFKEYQEYQIGFLEKLGEIIASAIVNANATVKTQQLLENARENEMQMKAQEEVMRQSMEEIQATQEEIERKEKEYLKQIEELKSQINN